MRGQLSIEYLFLALISLALIAIAIGALIKIKETGDRAYRLELFKSSALDIYNAGEELCAMGSGNSVNLKTREEIFISSDSGMVSFSSPALGVSFSRPARCPYSQQSISADSEIEIGNDGGEIRIY